MNPVDLGKVLEGISIPPFDPHLLVGFGTGDDAAVYKVREDLAIIHTLDFFTPVVDDPYSFGQIAAANALSDVYAMGGKPLMVLNIVCFPTSILDLQVLYEILKGGGDKVQEAGALVAGGHTIDDKEPKYGLSVMGTVHPDFLITNASAKVGDLLILTKPIGGGIITTGLKRGLIGGEILGEVIKVMGTLNDYPAKLMKGMGVNACTDITGFGLLGHAHELALSSGVSLKIKGDQVPLLRGTRSLVEKGVFPGGTKANFTFLQDKVDFPPSFTMVDRYILCDAMTSGGLLISLPMEKAYPLLKVLEEKLDPPPIIIGQVIEGQAGFIYVH